MMKKSKAKIISSSDLIKNSSGKLGKHMPEVRTGTGIHKSKKQYDRKSKNNQRLKRELKGYQKLAADFFMDFSKYYVRKLKTSMYFK